MTCTQALISLFLLVPCDSESGGLEAVESALQVSTLPATDLARDAERKPAEVLSFFGIEPGMTVLEVFAGGGYYTQILDKLVGKDGHVLAHNNAAYLGFVGPQFDNRFRDGGLPNVAQVIAEANDLALEPASLDAALMVLAYHDFFFGAAEFNWPDVDEAAFLDSLCAAMKPGAVLGVVDHVANPGEAVEDTAFRLHRIDPERVKADLTGSCFEYVEASDCLRNPEDDHSTSATEGPFKGHTDRFVFKFVRA